MPYSTYRPSFLSPFMKVTPMSSKTADKISWYRLPPEIRLLILEALLQDGCSLAGLATVSREWQTIIERHNFARIKLTPSRFADSGLIINRNRALVRYIGFAWNSENMIAPSVRSECKR
ncbi:uncharacterized protein BDV17DRAFT_253956 [Aspergillus undulatus]|uniref:uncharacterized protein n=1 Tax=Aspergillus undulatus TaxID=1810928 RepID=UPI003CCDF080